MLWIMSTEDHIFIFGKDKKMSGRCVFDAKKISCQKEFIW
jgi:hypothetical protein